MPLNNLNLLLQVFLQVSGNQRLARERVVHASVRQEIADHRWPPRSGKGYSDRHRL